MFLKKSQYCTRYLPANYNQLFKIQLLSKNQMDTIYTQKRKSVIETGFSILKKSFYDFIDKTSYDVRISTLKKGEFGGCYVFHNLNTGLYKIGISADINSRLSGVVCASGCKIKKLLWIKLGIDLDIKPVFAENLLHSHFRSKNVRGEWFKLNISDLIIIREFFTKVLIGTEHFDSLSSHVLDMMVEHEVDIWHPDSLFPPYEPRDIVVVKDHDIDFDECYDLDLDENDNYYWTTILELNRIKNHCLYDNELGSI